MKRNWKHPSKGTTLVVINGTTYRVPKNRARQFREAMGQPKIEKKSLVRNQWSNRPYRYE